MTLHAFQLEHERVMQGLVAYATLDNRKRALRFFENFIGGSVPLSKIKPRHAEAFIADRLSTVPSVATVNKDIRTLRHIFNLAIEPRGYLMDGQNPFTKIKERKTTEKEIRYVEIEEYRALMDKAKNKWWRAFLSIAYGCGLRSSEILYLTWKDIDFENQLIKVAAKKGTKDILEWEPKNRKNRIVPMSDEASQLLVNLQTEAKEGFSYIFVSPERLERIWQRQKIGRWNPRSQVINNLDRDFRLLRRKAGVDECVV
jgi:integrase